ncbi:VOC family protein [Neobacillus drentensis]|uniref:VOC family protein n=1 Tax=Neobacillus drentensis TaxID=220684 RepID=UPI001F47B9D7|nr:VOC family protein [Neobacillus drentensis]ULT57520.1 VOC family protein [Neobacillus drentensis]
MEQFHQEPNIYVGEVTIKVKSLAYSVTFYQNIIGLQLLEQSERKAVLTADGQTPLLTLEEPADVIPKQEGMSGLYHFAILLPSRTDLGDFLRHLILTGYPLGAADHYVSEALYLNDPDGNGIEVYRDRPSSEWTWKNGLVEMATEQLDAEGILEESNDEWKGLPSGTLMGHIHLHVGDLEKAKEFYTKGMGFEVVSYYPQAVFLSSGRYHHHVAINTWQGAGAPTPPKNSVGLNWYSIVFPNQEAREKVMEQLKQIGAPLSNEGNFYVTSDPAGNQIHLVV